MIPHLVAARGRDEGDETRDEVAGRQLDVGGPVAPPTLEGPASVAVGGQLQSVLGDGGAEDVAAQSLEAASLVPGDAGGSVEGEAVGVDAQGRGASDDGLGVS